MTTWAFGISAGLGGSTGTGGAELQLERKIPVKKAALRAKTEFGDMGTICLTNSNYTAGSDEHKGKGIFLMCWKNSICVLTEDLIAVFLAES